MNYVRLVKVSYKFSSDKRVGKYILFFEGKRGKVELYWSMDIERCDLFRVVVGII